MKTNSNRIYCTALGVLLALGSLSASAEMSIYKAQSSGSSVKIDGSSTIHNWTVEGKIIGGSFEVDSTFPIGGTPAVGPVNAKAKAVIPVRSLKSGKPKMDEVMLEHMKGDKFLKIDFELLGMNLKEAPKSATDPLVFDATGKLSISGVTRTNTMKVTCDRADVSKLKFKSVADIKMTDFGIQPPAPNIALGLIKTGDDVKVTIEWVTASQKSEPAK